MQRSLSGRIPQPAVARYAASCSTRTAHGSISMRPGCPPLAGAPNPGHVTVPGALAEIAAVSSRRGRMTMMASMTHPTSMITICPA